ncbi:hypothetical protein IC619_003020 [Hazenella sp. IB182353]|uniref:hypothetical protein n=1 Tax=Polycladospora coralii TaxID=2771432 RepID=UPI0017465577|nr:hypothetical protein [Polycladospora coralii]MBS7529469.1 hypothetical protein [Polycladospora coralii]
MELSYRRSVHFYENFYTQLKCDFIEGTLNGKYVKRSQNENIGIKYHRHMEGKVKISTIIRKNGKYDAVFTCEAEPVMQATGKGMGVDLHVKHLPK